MFRVGTRAEENGSRIVISTPFSHRNLTEKNKERKKKNGLVSLSTVEAAPKTIVRTLFDNKIAERRDRLWRIKKRTDIRGKIKVENNFLRILDKLSILFFFSLVEVSYLTSLFPRFIVIQVYGNFLICKSS